MLSDIISKKLNFTAEETKKLITLGQAGNHEEFNNMVFAKQAEECNWDLHAAGLEVVLHKIRQKLKQANVVDYAKTFDESLGDLEEALAARKTRPSTAVFNSADIPFKQFLNKTAAINAYVSQIGHIIEAARDGKQLCITLLSPKPENDIFLFYKNHAEITQELLDSINFNINIKTHANPGNSYP